MTSTAIGTWVHASVHRPAVVVTHAAADGTATAEVTVAVAVTVAVVAARVTVDRLVVITALMRIRWSSSSSNNNSVTVAVAGVTSAAVDTQTALGPVVAPVTRREVVDAARGRGVHEEVIAPEVEATVDR